MPTKLNRAGEQQNYVPAGNGDASGEYGDSATGSNKHFTTFKKPEQEQPKVIENGIKENETSNENEIKNESIESISSDKEKGKKLQNTINETTISDGIEIINKTLEKNTDVKVQFGGAGFDCAGCWNGSTIKLNLHDEHTFRHEFGHCVSARYGVLYPKNKDYFSQDMTVTFLDENGKCFNDYLHEDINMHPYHYEGWSVRKTGIDKRETIAQKVKPICELYNQFGDECFDEIAGEGSAKKYRDYVEKIKNANKKIGEEMAKIKDNEIDGYNEWVKIRDEMSQERTKWYRTHDYNYDSYFDNSSIYKEIKPKLDSAYQTLNSNREKIRKELTNKYGLTNEEQEDYNKLHDIKVFNKELSKKMDGLDGIIGDTLDYAPVGSVNYNTNGHGANYLKTSKNRDTTTSYSKEVFANMFDCYTNKEQRTYNYVKKMFPKTSAMFEKMIEEIRSK